MKVVQKSLRGFTLTEMLVVLVIISILVLLALPKLMPLVTRAKSKEAQVALGMVKTLENSYKLENDRYSDDLKTIGFEQEKLVSQGGSAKYSITIVKADANTFEAKATAVVDFDNDGNFNTWTLTEDGKIVETIQD